MANNMWIDPKMGSPVPRPRSQQQTFKRLSKGKLQAPEIAALAGMSDAELTHVSPMQPDGYIYADYRCTSNYSNIFRFKVHQVRLDSNGNILEQKESFRAPGAKKAPKL